MNYKQIIRYEDYYWEKYVSFVSAKFLAECKVYAYITTELIHIH